ncbi:hypothetical protein CYMTET_50144 [Cymbomonas tetramitiformis]|uniref:Uncharacterized protein n=1 Tax=Cymbomonas tetramitiformis TaxID=36881 RepID=A0AAE0ETT0_9CHLO|nr:hypothetical protein CYMTET_50144 [Cymbomonas tetramitiformis]|eukprot:gene10270-12149_t
MEALPGYSTINLDGMKDVVSNTNTVNVTSTKGGLSKYLTTYMPGQRKEDAAFYAQCTKKALESDAPFVGEEPTVLEKNTFVRKTYAGICADNVVYMRNSQRLVLAAYGFLFAIGCITHILDLLCEDIAKVSEIGDLLANALKLIKFVRSHPRIRGGFTSSHT